MSHNSSREHDRELERHAVKGAVDVYDSRRNVYVGRLVNIHAQGLMVVGDIALEEDRIYTFDLRVPESVAGQMTIQIGVDCLWARDADLSGKHWMGFSIIDASPEANTAIAELVNHFDDVA